MRMMAGEIKEERSMHVMEDLVKATEFYKSNVENKSI